MAAYADYTYYTGTYLGTAIAESAFPQLALRATAVIDQLTFNRASVVVETGTDTDTIDKIKMATCAVAEKLQGLEASGGTIQSERVGNVSVTYADSKPTQWILTDSAKVYLWDTDLMYRGLLDTE